MKRIVTVGLIVSIFCITFLFSAVVAAGPKESAKGHDTSTLPKALIGHWAPTSTTTHYYFDSKSLITITDGKRTALNYTVVQSNEAENSIHIRVRTQEDKGHDKQLIFSSDRNSFDETIRIRMGDKVMSFTYQYKYVDSNTRP